MSYAIAYINRAGLSIYNNFRNEITTLIEYSIVSKYDNMVDFIITHCCSSSTQREISYRGSYEPDIETDYLESIKTQTHYKKWFFGHYHDNMNVSDKEILIYEQIIRIQ